MIRQNLKFDIIIYIIGRRKARYETNVWFIWATLLF